MSDELDALSFFSDPDEDETARTYEEILETTLCKVRESATGLHWGFPEVYPAGYARYWFGHDKNLWVQGEDTYQKEWGLWSVLCEEFIDHLYEESIPVHLTPQMLHRHFREDAWVPTSRYRGRRASPQRFAILTCIRDLYPDYFDGCRFNRGGYWGEDGEGRPQWHITKGEGFLDIHPVEWLPVGACLERGQDIRAALCHEHYRNADYAKLYTNSKWTEISRKMWGIKPPKYRSKILSELGGVSPEKKRQTKTPFPPKKGGDLDMK